MAAIAIPAALGAFGLYQNAQAQKKQSDLQSQALKAGKPQLAAQQAQFELAKGYNPALEDKQALTAANQNASQLLSHNLGQLAGSWAGGGESPTGDTAFGMAAQNTANRTIDPLRQTEAQLQSTETARKSAMYNSVYQAPAGQLANTYFQAAANSAPNYGPSLNYLTQAFNKLIAPKAASSGIGTVDAGNGLPGSTEGPGGIFHL